MSKELGVPEALDPEEGQKAIATAVTISSQVNPNRSIVLQTYMPRDAPVKDYHLLLDKLVRAADRQEAKANLGGLKTSLASTQKTLKQMEEDFGNIETRAAAAWVAKNKKGEPKLSDNEVAQKGIATQNVKRFREEVAKIEAEIAECEAEIARED